MTRAGVMLTFDRSAKACQATLTYPLEREIRGGTRIRTDRGEGAIIGTTVLGVRRVALPPPSPPPPPVLPCPRSSCRFRVHALHHLLASPPPLYVLSLVPRVRRHCE